jgi:hypothetical protein
VHLPPEALEFHHLSQEYFLPSEKWDGKVTTCDGSGEDNKCADQYTLHVSIDDHLQYLGIGLGVNRC